MTEQQPTSPRRRQQELLAIPERQRTDAQWDELNELEIVLAPVNRAETHEPNVRRNAPPATVQARPNGGTPVKKPARKFHKRPPKAPTP
ncbi:MAG: hypothetical protein PHZ14_11885 [Sulfuricella sp.]|jgi:hypothetical protein|nr:hypothetical protein [Sulfuricella sp.]